MNGEWYLPQIPLHHKPNKKILWKLDKTYTIKSLNIFEKSERFRSKAHFYQCRLCCNLGKTTPGIRGVKGYERIAWGGGLGGLVVKKGEDIFFLIPFCMLVTEVT
jgi:hypothetical protein